MLDPRATGDEELVRQAQQGKLEAFTALYERYLPKVFNRVRYSIPTADVEDVTQEVFISVMRSLKSFRYEARFSTWLRTLVRRQIADYYRSRKLPEEKSIMLSETNPEYPHHSSTLEISDKIDNVIVLRQGLERLPEHYQEVIFLRFVEGMQFNEIAEERAQSLEATKSLFRRAIAALREQIIENA